VYVCVRVCACVRVCVCAILSRARSINRVLLSTFALTKNWPQKNAKVLGILHCHIKIKINHCQKAQNCTNYNYNDLRKTGPKGATAR
jgi:hypothetical protein